MWEEIVSLWKVSVAWVLCVKYVCECVGGREGYLGEHQAREKLHLNAVSIIYMSHREY